MAAVMAAERRPADESLVAQLAGKRKEAASLREMITQTRLQATHVGLQLQALGVSDPSLVPSRLRSGSGSSEALHPELRSLLEWLAECVDLTRQVTFECGGGGTGVAVGGRRVLLQRMAAMPLGTGPTSKLQLSIPLELQGEITALLAKVRARACRVGEADLVAVAEKWELVGAEMVSAATGQQEPAIFLVHRGGGVDVGAKPARAIVIAQWPSVDFGQLSAASAFDPERHFGRLAATPVLEKPIGGAQEDERPGAAEAEAEAQAASRLLAEEARGEAATATEARVKVSTGDRVVIKYRGQWFHGVLQRVDVACKVANVKCDADSPGVITVVPLASVWPAGAPPPEDLQRQAVTMRPDEVQHKQVLRHARAKTVG